MAGVNQPDFRDPVLSSRILGWPWDGSTAVPRVQPPNFERFSSELVATDALYVSDDKGTLIWYMSEIKRIKEVPPHPSPYIGHTCCIRCTCSQHVSGDLFFAVAQSPDIGFWSSPPPHRSATSGIACGCSYANNYKGTHARCTCEY